MWQRDLIDDCRTATLGTIARDGRPHLVPVCFALIEGRFAIAIDEKPKRSVRLARLANIERDPRVTLLFEQYSEDWTRLAWVRVDGTAEARPRGDTWTEALGALRARYAQYRSMALEGRPLIVVTPGKIAGWRASG